MKKRFRKINRRSGFTLVETLVSLMIFSIIILVISMLLNNVHNDHNYNSAAQFYSYLDVVENQHYQLKSTESNQLKLMKNHKIYYINLNPNKNQLIMSTNAGGCMMLMKHVKSVRWRYDDGLIYHHVIMMNGEQFNGKSKFRKS